MLARNWEGQNPTGWLMSEKCDGVRAIWTGSELLTRNGNAIKAPASFIAKLPDGFALDGEIWAGRGGFERAKSAVAGGSWVGIRFAVFDAPEAVGGFEARIAAAEVAVAGNTVAFVLTQTKCLGIVDLDDTLATICNEGGEGVCLRKSGSNYTPGKSNALLKRKLRETDEAVVVGHSVEVDSVVVRWGASTFNLGCSGKLFSLGAVVTFSYCGTHESGEPKHAVIVTERDYE